MDVANALPSVVVAVVAVTAVVSGPLVSVDLTPDPTTCDEDVRPERGNATVTVHSLPDRATLSRSEFGADVWRLDIPPARVNVTDIERRPTVSYRIQIPELGRTAGVRTVFSHCTTGRVPLRIDQPTFQPETVDNETYDATLFVTYRGTENGTKVERTLAERNVTVVVRE